MIRRISNLRYADDTTLMGTSADEVKELLIKIKPASEAAGLDLNLAKTKVMTTTNDTHLDIDGEAIDVVESFNFLGALISPRNLYSQDTNRRIGLGKAAVIGLCKIWKDKNFPIVTYECKSWVINKKDRKRIDSFEMWCF
ncbi:uncharacterized protein LOC125032835 [Penaeus chinensis]|uniref:uncharacterized protein LOC125032835 n=1 Tax=Penaeus chinensis TaxID=139456 RepID=UPI001FB838ED|nr:uncharacterized protein LOC125032835 [Penaeus chinensis]